MYLQLFFDLFIALNCFWYILMIMILTSATCNSWLHRGHKLFSQKKKCDSTHQNEPFFLFSKSGSYCIYSVKNITQNWIRILVHNVNKNEDILRNCSKDEFWFCVTCDESMQSDKFWNNTLSLHNCICNYFLIRL